MDILLLLSFFILGAIVGSFLNVVIFRLNTGRGIGGRSACTSCGKVLGYFDLIPIVSFLLLRGKCRHCGSRISGQYFFVEFCTGILFSLIFLLYLRESDSGVLSVLISLLLPAVLSSVLVVIFFYDLRHKIIPNRLSTLVLIMASVHLLLLYLSRGEFQILYFYAAGGVIPASIIWLLWKISGGRWIGLGDAKLFLGVGMFLTIPQSLSAFVFSFWAGAAYALSSLFMQMIRDDSLREGEKKLTMKSEIPFAPFIIVGFFISYFFRSDILGLMPLFQ